MRCVWCVHDDDQHGCKRATSQVPAEIILPSLRGPSRMTASQNNLQSTILAEGCRVRCTRCCQEGPSRCYTTTTIMQNMEQPNNSAAQNTNILALIPQYSEGIPIQNLPAETLHPQTLHATYPLQPPKLPSKQPAHCICSAVQKLYKQETAPSCLSIAPRP